MSGFTDYLPGPWRHLNPATQKLLLGLTLGALAQSFLGSLYDRATQEKLPVLVIRQDLATPTELTAEALEVRAVPSAYVPKSAITPQDQSLILRRVTRTPLRAGEILRWADLKSERDLEHLSARIPQGYRAYRLSLAETAGLADHLKPGDVVDILGSFHSSTTRRQVTRTLFQNVTILSTKPEILVVLAPEQVELLTFARQEGTLTLSLRNTGDHQDPPPLPEVAFHRFIAGEPTAAVAPAAKGPQILQLGSQRKKP